MDNKKAEYSPWKVIIGVILGVIVLIYLGGLTGFFPFGGFGDNLAARMIAYCTVIICAVMVLCTAVIVRAIKGAA